MDLWEGSLKGQDWEVFGCIFACLFLFLKKNLEVWGLLLAFGLHQTFSPLALFQPKNV